MQHQELMESDKQLKDVKDLRVMCEHDIIGITTTACASRWDTLRALEPEILICEEAAEVTEAHALCTFLPSLKHGIFIGDPQQLRPEVKEQLMTLETRAGSLYRLDESLFERIMMPRDPLACALPTSHLDVQRRMHPQIAKISRLTYPFLKDHDSTMAHPPPKGIGQRLFWLDHRVPEDIEPEVSDSVFNLHEAFLVRAFVKYLLKGSGYSYGDIAVLTPYAAQLLKLHEMLRSTCAIWLSDKDRELLLDVGDLDIELEKSQGKTEVEMRNMLRVATVDNFQGEEAKVIILSTVRSGGEPGFLKTHNRINVACSRARDGFYIFGNSQTLSKVHMWSDVVDVFNEMGARDTSMLLRCDRHPEHNTQASTAQDFETFGDCTKLCNSSLPCGHQCLEQCHDPELHDRIACSHACDKVLNCGHQCRKPCADDCGFCAEIAEEITLSCGHMGVKYCSGEITECSKIVEERNLSCGRHTIEVQCAKQTEEHVCKERCGIYLPCGHECSGLCESCNSTSKHEPCTKVCQSTLACGHKCQATCHNGKYCPPCQEQCPKSCAHGTCKLFCSQPCSPCTRKALTICSHEDKSTEICSLPSLQIPCSVLCEKTLECGHPCPSLHSEICPPKDRCPQCHGGDLAELTQLYSTTCGHLFSLKACDELNLGKFYETEANDIIIGFNTDCTHSDLHRPCCPICNSELSLHRYEAILKAVEFADVFDRHLSRLGQKLATFSISIEMQDERLEISFRQFEDDIRPDPRAANVNSLIILKRDREVDTLRARIVEVRDQEVDVLQQHLIKLHQTWPNLIRNYTMMFRLHMEVLEYRVMRISIADKIRTARYLLGVEEPTNELRRQALIMLEFAFTECIAGIKYCQGTIEDRCLTTNPCLEAEVMLHQVQFRILAENASQQLQPGFSRTQALELVMSHSELLKNLRAVEIISRKYPSRCRSYLKLAHKFHEYLTSSNDKQSLSIDNRKTIPLKDIPSVSSFEGRIVERRWGEHVLGHLTTCNVGHPYSLATFPDFCPECVKREETNEEELTRVKSHLFEADFLAAIKR